MLLNTYMFINQVRELGRVVEPGHWVNVVLGFTPSYRINSWLCFILVYLIPSLIFAVSYTSCTSCRHHDTDHYFCVLNIM